MKEKEILNNKVSFSVNLWFEGMDLDPERITKDLGVEPIKSWRRGDLRHEPHPAFENGGWVIGIKGGWGDNLKGLLVELFGLFESREDLLAKYIDEYHSYISIGLFYQTDFICSPTLGLEAEMVNKISNLNLDLFINVYPCSTP
jgi:hypothetical protein